MKKILILLVLLFSISVSSLVWGAENYDDCVLKNLKGIGSDVAAKAIIDVCKGEALDQYIKEDNLNTTLSICFETEAKIINDIIFLPNMTQPYTGDNLCKYINGQIKSKGQIKDGKLDGKSTWWFENGQKGLEKNYKDGKLDGKSTWWYGQIMLDGQLDSQIMLDGQLEKEKNYKNGKLDGKMSTWYKNGQIKSEINYKDGKQKDGKQTYWYESGQIKSEINYKDGKKDGKVTTWYEHGQLWSEINYKDGKKDGKQTYWYENGQLWSEEHYKDDKCISGC